MPNLVQPPMPKASPVRILLVDDTEANRYAMARHLTRAGYHIFEAASGQEAMERMGERPDLVILDVKLPDISGFEISRMLRANPETSTIPLLQISATFTLSSDKARGLDAGADAYLTGPVQPEELLANVRMLLRLKQAQEALNKSNERLHSVLSTILDVYFAVDFEFHFVELNPAAEELFGKSSSDLVGKPLFDEFPQAKETEFLRQFERAASTRQPVHFETASAIRPGIWWEAHAYPRDDRIDIYLRNITQRKVYEKELSTARDLLSAQNELLESRVNERTAKLQETISDLETFSYSITHDMRAPLRAMQGFAKLLIESHGPQLDAEAQDYLNRIANSANRLDLLIRDVLTYSNIVRSPLQLVPVDADKLAREIIVDYPGLQSPAAEVTISGKLPLVKANEAFLTQCFSNLLGNAVKFVEPNTIPRVNISAELRDNGVRINFQDSGIGIPREYQERLFNLFHRGQNRYPGTGVGLAVVRKAVERMGGQVGLDSVPGKGSTFWLQLQAAET